MIPNDLIPQRLEPYEKNELLLLIHILFDFTGKVWASCANHLSIDVFTKPEHQIVYQTMTKTAQKEEEINAVTCLPYIPEGFLSYFSALSDIAEAQPTLAHWETYLKLVVDAHVMREAQKWAGSMKLIPQDPQETLEKIKNQAELLAQKTHTKSNLQSSRVALKTFHEDLENRFNSGEAFDSITTGIQKLDALFNGGIRKNELIIIAARPSMGKTALAMDFFLAPYLSKKQGAIFFSLEMDTQDLTRRMIAHHARIKSSALLTGDFEYLEGKLAQMLRSMGALATDKLLIDDTVDQTVENIEATIQRQWKTSGKPSVVIVDYLQLMHATGDSYSRENEVAKISRGLKKIAKKYELPIVVLSQINRQCETRKDGRPMLSDLRESGAIEQDADKIIFVHRPHVLGKSDDPEEAELIVAKNRNGGIGIINARFDGEHTRFYG